MATHTCSLSWPQMIDVARNQVAVLEDNQSVVNRTKLLILTSPTELYNSPKFGVGLNKYLWQYNTENTKAIIKDRIKEQLRTYEPCVDADKTSFADGLLFTGDGDPESSVADQNQLKMTIGLQTTYEDTLTVSIDIEAERLKTFNSQEV